MPAQPASRSYIVALLLALIVTIPPAVGAQTPARQTRPLRVAYMSTSVTMAPLWMAKEVGGFAKERLDVEMLSINASVAVPAVIAKELDAIEISAAPVLTASLRGQDVIFVAGLSNAPAKSGREPSMSMVGARVDS